MKEVKEQSGQEPISATRRRLLKASAAAPLLASLAPNTALAMSSAAQCVGNPEFATFPEAVAVGSDDTAVRVTIPVFTYNGNGNPPQQLPTVLYQIGDAYFGADGASYSPNGNALNQFDESSVEVLQLFNAHGEPIGLWPEVQISPSATPLSGSCWASLDANDMVAFN